MKKADFIKILKEGNGVPSIQDINTAATNVEKMAQTVDKLGDSMSKLKDMGVVDEEFDAAKEYESQTEFFMDMIDSLMFKNFKVTYFKPIPTSEPNQEPESEKEPDPQLSLDFPKEKTYEIPKEDTPKPISQMSDSEFKSFTDSKISFGGDGSLFYVINLIKKGLAELESGEENQKSNPLRPAYIALQDLSRKNLEENFADSKIFTIIAEAETPKISKQEILEYLNRKQNG
jgi:hypothetical protein